MRFISYLSIKIGQLVSWFFLISVLITGYEVAMRYVFNAPTIWVYDLSIALSASAIILSGSFVLQQRDHIAITAFHHMLSERWQDRLDLFNSLFCSVVCACVAWAGWSFGWTAFSSWETTGSGWDVPIPALLKPLITLSAVMMTLQATCNFVSDLIGNANPEAE
ncbi:putative gluconate TRAP family transporter, DctQ subunit [Marinobacterium lacunae]|uniref:TRAP transporter small permease protein n=1 Tax=Marinobacterium lacunae TaxID=1232683 RepID=A0A081G3C7_9GAMM|nr:TRAP transporter small permease subunit [Marinobacterium lacunae]KEA65282.1 putative gluconate TRAP family transporter, DctQ subunit [Marinobacterium lacunae]